MTRGKKLTDKKIDQYSKRGFYDEDFREARRKLWQSKKRKRDGNFNIEGDRIIYCPI